MHVYIDNKDCATCIYSGRADTVGEGGVGVKVRSTLLVLGSGQKKIV